MKKQLGLVHLYVGDGKGKTTAAVGLAVRALGYGKKVLFCQFLKGRSTGEIEPLGKLGADVLRAKSLEKFVFRMNGEELEQTKKDHMTAIEQIGEMIAGGEYELVVLDEVVDAVNCGIVPLEILTALVRSRPERVEVVLSGRNPPPEIEALSDYYTTFTMRKHPYAEGIAAREGIEY